MQCTQILGNCKYNKIMLNSQIKMVKKVSAIDTMRNMPRGAVWNVSYRIATYNTIKSCQRRLRDEGFDFKVSQKGIDVTVERIK